MRVKFNPQMSLDLGPSHLKVTREYFRKYQAVNEILLESPQILEAFHRELCRMGKRGRRRLARYTSDQCFRAILVMEIEGLPFRETVIRIDDSQMLRNFVGVGQGVVMDFTTLAKVYKAIRPGTWKRINILLGHYAIEREMITGESLRVDTTVYETDVHYPTDSSLLWDSYRILSRWIAEVREHDGGVVGCGRLQERRVKRLSRGIARGAKTKNRARLRGLYKALLGHVEHVLGWSRDVARRCEQSLVKGRYDEETARIIEKMVARQTHVDGVVARVIDQARRRVLYGERVPNSEKILSLFEPHTELLKRGKARKPLEFGHMVLLGQVEHKFISDYDVFERQPKETSLIDGILSRHEEKFDHGLENFTADRGFYESTDQLAALEETIANVSIGKKGSRTAEEIEREHDPIFKALQRYRAGIEGTISYLKRCFKMCRCLYRSFTTYCSSVGSHVFAHNLIVLSRL